MKRQHIIAAAALLGAALLPAAADANVKVTLPAKTTAKFEITPIDKLQTVRDGSATHTMDFGGKPDDKFEAAYAPMGPSMVAIHIGDYGTVPVYAAPDENVVVNVGSLSPFQYTISGTRLMEDLGNLGEFTVAIEEEASKIMQSPQPDMQRMQQLQDEYMAVQKAFLKANPDSPAAPFAVLNLEGEDFVEAAEALGPGAKSSIAYVLVEQRLPMVRKQVDDERAQRALASGTVDAPLFSLEDTQGKQVSLSDFRGKWVILDFWGSWCIWCVRGFPHLKEAYEQHKGQLEVIGIDCGDTRQKWLDAVAKYELPWVNVYKPEDNNLEQAYRVQGFPTKVIVNPEGKIVDITTGDDPAFYDRLNALMSR